MAIILDQKAHRDLQRTLSRRLKAARKSAGMTEGDAAKALGLKGVTQISLMEKEGGRPPPLTALVKLADAYSVPLDFLTGRIDDPVADPCETNHGIITRMVAKGLRDNFDAFTSALAENAAVSIAGQREDRKDLERMSESAQKAMQALARIKTLNPEFEEEWRGSATLEAALREIAAIADRVTARVERERKMRELIDPVERPDRIDAQVHQFMLELMPR